MATCHTSVLMNRKVTNSSSSGSARVTVGTSSRTLPSVRCSAQRRIGRARSAVTPYAAAASTATSVSVAGATVWSSDAAHATSAVTRTAATTVPTSSGTVRRGRRAARAAARCSGTK